MKTIIFLTIAFIFILISNQDYIDAQAEEAHYCDMAERGLWPDRDELDCNAN